MPITTGSAPKTLSGKKNATKDRKKQTSCVAKHKNGNKGGKAKETGSGYCLVKSRKK